MPTHDWRTRTLSAYSIHGRYRDSLLDYGAFFEQFVGVTGERRTRHEILGQTVTLTKATRIEEGLIALRFVAGNEAELPLFFNTITGEEEIVESDGGMFVVGTWAIVNPDTRMVAIETKRPGVGSVLIERYLELEGRRRGFPELRIDLNQASTEGFDFAVRRLDTVKKVAVTVNQPNLDWSDDHNEIHEYAEQSGAGSATVEMRAPRGEGLSQARGIVADVIGLSRQRISSLRNVIVTGSEAGEPDDKTINLNRFQRKQSVRIRRNSTPTEELEAITPAARSLVESEDD